MIHTLTSMFTPVAYLIVAGLTTLGLAWWAAIEFEGRDEWLTGADDDRA